jgi:MerR family transcriptional regulator, light-induced transcriptional regulator
MSAGRRTPPLHYPIRAAARLTGISVDTLRAWERRYGAVTPSRNDRGRLYSQADVARLQTLAELVRRGHAIGTIARLGNDELGRLVEGSGTERSGAPDGTASDLDLDTLTAALDRYDHDAIESAVSRYAVILPPRDLVFAVVLPLLREVGTRWAGGRLRPAQEHLLTSSVRSVLGGLLRTSARPQASPKIVFATPTGERHEIGLLAAALLASTAGCGVVYLGADLPAAEIRDAALAAGARLVLVSLTTPGAVPRAEIRMLANLPAPLELWVGGPAAGSLVTAAGDSVRHVHDLADLLDLLPRHLR